MKKMMLFVLLGVFGTNICFAFENEKMSYGEFFNQTAKRICFGYTTLAFGGFSLAAELGFRAAQQKENRLYTQKLLRGAKVSRSIGYVGVLPLVSTFIVNLNQKIAKNEAVQNEAVQAVVGITIIPAAGMVVIPAVILANHKERQGELQKKKYERTEDWLIAIEPKDE